MPQPKVCEKNEVRLLLFKLGACSFKALYIIRSIVNLDCLKYPNTLSVELTQVQWNFSYPNRLGSKGFGYRNVRTCF